MWNQSTAAAVCGLIRHKHTSIHCPYSSSYNLVITNSTEHRFLLQMSIITILVKKFPPSCGILSFINMSTRACHWNIFFFISFLNGSTALCGPSPLFQFPDPIHNRQDTLNEWSANRKASTETLDRKWPIILLRGPPWGLRFFNVQ
jgi:hypothetical protein